MAAASSSRSSSRTPSFFMRRPRLVDIAQHLIPAAVAPAAAPLLSLPTCQSSPLPEVAAAHPVRMVEARVLLTHPRLPVQTVAAQATAGEVVRKLLPAPQVLIQQDIPRQADLLVPAEMGAIQF